jgi:Peptidase family M28
MTPMSDAMERLCASVDVPTMMVHLEEFARRIKLSGTSEELASLHYVEGCLRSYGYKTDLIQHDAYISLPEAARIEIGTDFPDCITHSFSRSSPAGGLRGHVVYAGFGSASDLRNANVCGKIVLLEAIANPTASLRASDAGAVGQIHISPHEHLHEMCISPIWGSPTDETLGSLPKTVVLSIRKSDGEALKQRVVAEGGVEVTLHAKVDTGWRKTPILVAEMPASTNDHEMFVMVSGHHDTWYYGVMDNGGANATMLEVARLVAAEEALWRRGIRFCFWSGHSHGRYSSSTWYADAHWSELAGRCVAHVNVDSTGATGNTVLADAPASAELLGLASEAVHVRGGQKLDGLRMSRAGDQSFWGIGIPSIFMGMGEQPIGTTDNVLAAVLGDKARKGAGFGWWWHTPEDTLDKMDRDILLRDTRIYLHAVWRLLTDQILPLDYEAQLDSLSGQVRPLADSLRDVVDLGSIEVRIGALKARIAALKDRCGHVEDEGEILAINRTLVCLSRALVPLDYTNGDRFDHGPALGQPPYPILEPLRRLASSLQGSDSAKFSAVAAARARNRLGFALDQATQALEACT